MELRDVHAALARWVVHCEMIPWDNADVANWQALKRSIVLHGVGALLGARGAAPGPAWFKTFLDEQRDNAAARVTRLVRESFTVRAEADRTGIDLVPLKGAALAQFSDFPLAQRPMNDIDLLVRENQRPQLEKLLHSLDYQLSEASPRHWEFTCQRYNTSVVYLEGDHPDNPVKLEVHTWVGQELLSARRVCVTQALWEARDSLRGVLLHLLVHTGANAAKRRLRLAHLLDLTLLLRNADNDDLEWMAAQAACAQPLVYSALRLAERYGGLPEIPDVLRVMRAGCTPSLIATLDSASLVEFTLEAPLTLEWEMLWLPRGESALRWRLARAVPLHRLWLDPVRLRERYRLPHDAPLAGAYARHYFRAFAWPVILAARLLKGRS